MSSLRLLSILLVSLTAKQIVAANVAPKSDASSAAEANFLNPSSNSNNQLNDHLNIQINQLIHRLAASIKSPQSLQQQPQQQQQQPKLSPMERRKAVTIGFNRWLKPLTFQVPDVLSNLIPSSSNLIKVHESPKNKTDLSNSDQQQQQQQQQQLPQSQSNQGMLPYDPLQLLNAYNSHPFEQFSQSAPAASFPTTFNAIKSVNNNNNNSFSSNGFGAFSDMASLAPMFSSSAFGALSGAMAGQDGSKLTNNKFQTIPLFQSDDSFLPEMSEGGANKNRHPFFGSDDDHHQQQQQQQQQQSYHGGHSHRFPFTQQHHHPLLQHHHQHHHHHNMNEETTSSGIDGTASPSFRQTNVYRSRPTPMNSVGGEEGLTTPSYAFGGRLNSASMRDPYFSPPEGSASSERATNSYSQEFQSKLPYYEKLMNELDNDKSMDGPYGNKPNSGASNFFHSDNKDENSERLYFRDYISGQKNSHSNNNNNNGNLSPNINNEGGSSSSVGGGPSSIINGHQVTPNDYYNGKPSEDSNQAPNDSIDSNIGGKSNSGNNQAEAQSNYHPYYSNNFQSAASMNTPVFVKSNANLDNESDKMLSAPSVVAAAAAASMLRPEHASLEHFLNVARPMEPAFPDAQMKTTLTRPVTNRIKDFFKSMINPKT